MKLQDIGFYTLEDERAKNTSLISSLWRNELIITSKCNFNCPYCRGTNINGKHGEMSFDDIKYIINLWADNNIQNIRFSGGEPTLHKNIFDIIKYTKSKCKGIKHIAISTNGYSDIEMYKKLIKLGVNDFSISLDACCSSIGDMMSGNITGSWNKVTKNIKELSKLTYVTVGMVFDEKNCNEIKESIEFADSLGVSDIRIITAAQFNDFSIFENLNINKNILNRNKILKYRINNFKNNRNVRGITKKDCKVCYLMMDDMIVKGNFHYPCVIHMREHGTPIGSIKNKSIEQIRQERFDYMISHNSFKDELCRKNCLDVCIDYNNKVDFFRNKQRS